MIEEEKMKYHSLFDINYFMYDQNAKRFKRALIILGFKKNTELTESPTQILAD